MEPGQQEEWYELREGILDHLRQRDHILRSKFRPLLQFLVMPSFSDTWCIDFVESGGELSAYQTMWRSSKDVLAFETGLARLKFPRPFVPTLESNKLNVASATIEVILSQLSGQGVPAELEPTSIRLDGTGFELQFGDKADITQITWHNRCPTDWPSGLCEAVSSIYSLAEDIDE